MPFKIIRNDITKVHADAIVNTANPKPIYASGTDAAIYKAAGHEQLLSARKKIGDITPGQAAETPAFNLQAKYIIHTVGPVWEGGDQGEYDILQSCYRNSMQLAVRLGCQSIAFPLIATGVYGFPKDKALQIAMTCIQSFVMDHDLLVYLVVFDKKSFVLSGKVVDKIEAYVDANYVAEAEEDEYGLGFDVRGNAALGGAMRVTGATRPKFTFAASDFDQEEPDKKVDIDSLLADAGMTFQEKLFEYIDASGLKNSQIYNPVGISKQVFSKMQADKYYHPTKATAILFCLSLHLSLEQTTDLLSRAGWALSNSSKPDLVVKGCIINKQYNLMDVDAIMFDKCDTTVAEIK